MNKKRWILACIILIIAFVSIAFLVDQFFIRSAKNQRRVTFSGVSVCLPHRGGGEVQTLECAIGLRTDEGKYYSIADASFFDTNVRIEVTGDIIPPEKDSRYKIEGTIEKASVRRIQ